MKKNLGILSLLFVLSYFLILIFKNEVVEDKILLGQSASLTGSAQNLGIEYTKGANAYFNYINDLGGVFNRKIELITLDDAYEPEYAKQNTLELIKEKKVFAMFGEIGTPTSEAVLPIIKKYNIPFLMPLSGGSFLREDDSGLIINLRKSYNDEIKALIDYLVNEQNIKRVAVLYQNDNYGKLGFIRVQNALKKYQLQVIEEGRYRRNTLSFHTALENIKNANPEAVVIIGTYKPAASFIKEAKKLGLNDTKFCNISFIGGDSFVKELKGNTKNVIISQVLPIPWDENNIATKEYREIYHKYYPNDDFTFVSFEGFLSAKLVVKALEKSGENLNRKNFLASFKKLDKNVLDGFEINFSKNDNEALDEIYILDYEDSQYRVLKKVKIND
jgi:ABC-type branched-subunit amino acid transport system substrate-binding protein